MQRAYSPADILIDHADRVLRTLAGHAKTTGRDNPADSASHAELSDEEAKLSARLMRVNHAANGSQ
jgi:ubiquinone biosynthesis monooxygenase Coq7